MLYIFDIDGTLIRSFLREGGGRDEFDLVEALPGRKERIEALAREPKARFALATNQGGVAFGYQSVEQVWRKMGAIVAEFRGFGERPLSVHVCMEHPNGTDPEFARASDRRKPRPGLLLDAAAAHGVRLRPRSFLGQLWEGLMTMELFVPDRECLFVGDMDTDRQAAREARWEGLLVDYMDAGEFFA